MRGMIIGGLMGFIVALAISLVVGGINPGGGFILGAVCGMVGAVVGDYIWG